METFGGSRRLGRRERKQENAIAGEPKRNSQREGRFESSFEQKALTVTMRKNKTIINALKFGFLYIYSKLVGGFNPIPKYESNWIISPTRGEHKTYLTTPLEKISSLKETNHPFSRGIKWYKFQCVPPPMVKASYFFTGKTRRKILKSNNHPNQRDLSGFERKRWVGSVA